MSRKVFTVFVEFDVHALTCPGVWLCPRGDLTLRIFMFDLCAETTKQKSTFPVLCHEKFVFHKVFQNATSLADLQNILQQENMSAELIQWASATKGNVLATFQSNLADVLYPVSNYNKSFIAGVDVDLLMEPLKTFPGIIAPKVEVSTKTSIEEVLSKCKCSPIDRKMVASMATAHREQNIRQKKVCHTSIYHKACTAPNYCQKKTGRHFVGKRPNVLKPRGPSIYNDYPLNRYDTGSLDSLIDKSPPLTWRTASGRIYDHNMYNETAMKSKPLWNVQKVEPAVCTCSTGNCPVCSKYKMYFDDFTEKPANDNIVSLYPNRDNSPSYSKRNSEFENMYRKNSPEDMIYKDPVDEDLTKKSSYKKQEDNLHCKCCLCKSEETNCGCRKNNELQKSSSKLSFKDKKTSKDLGERKGSSSKLTEDAKDDQKNKCNCKKSSSKTVENGESKKSSYKSLKDANSDGNTGKKKCACKKTKGDEIDLNQNIDILENRDSRSDATSEKKKCACKKTKENLNEDIDETESKKSSQKSLKDEDKYCCCKKSEETANVENIESKKNSLKSIKDGNKYCSCKASELIENIDSRKNSLKTIKEVESDKKCGCKKSKDSYGAAVDVDKVRSFKLSNEIKSNVVTCICKKSTLKSISGNNINKDKYGISSGQTSKQTAGLTGSGRSSATKRTDSNLYSGSDKSITEQIVSRPSGCTCDDVPKKSMAMEIHNRLGSTLNPGNNYPFITDKELNSHIQCKCKIHCRKVKIDQHPKISNVDLAQIDTMYKEEFYKNLAQFYKQLYQYSKNKFVIEEVIECG